MDSKKEFQKLINLSDLSVGDIVRGRSSGNTFVVTCNYGTHVTAVTSIDITNPPEWEVFKNKHDK